MVGFMGMGMRGNKITMKRKDSDLDMDGLHHDFSDFSLSSPARKIRRLDAELPPIMEEEDELQEISCSAAPAFMEESESESESGSVTDKAIVLFKPLKSPLLSCSPSSISVDSDLISGFKDQFVRATTQQKRSTIEEDKAVSSSNKECLAVVPWAPPSQLIVPPTTSGIEIPQVPTEQPELTMEAMDSMEIEDTNENPLQLGQSGDGFGGIAGMRMGGEGLLHWQQQHCMVPQPPHYTSTPITWFQ